MSGKPLLKPIFQGKAAQKESSVNKSYLTHHWIHSSDRSTQFQQVNPVPRGQPIPSSSSLPLPERKTGGFRAKHVAARLTAPQVAQWLTAAWRRVGSSIEPARSCSFLLECCVGHVDKTWILEGVGEQKVLAGHRTCDQHPCAGSNRPCLMRAPGSCRLSTALTKSGLPSSTCGAGHLQLWKAPLRLDLPSCPTELVLTLRLRSELLGTG